VCILFGLFAYENLDAMKDTTAQRFATLEAIKQFDSGERLFTILPSEFSRYSLRNRLRDALQPIS
jgi:hypothetical protein